MTLQKNNIETKQNTEHSILQHSLQEENKIAKDTLSNLNPVMREQISLLFQDTKDIEKQFSTIKTQEQWEHLQNGLTKLLDTLSQYESLQNRLQSQPFPVNIVELCEKIASTFKNTAHYRHIQFSFENNLTNDAAFTHYSCDGKKMQEALMRLLTNAFDIINEGDGSFIHFKLENAENDSCSIKIKRDGSSLSETDLTNLSSGIVSKEFFQHHSGILCCKELMDSFHGKFTISSQEESTQFTLEFPCTKCA